MPQFESIPTQSRASRALQRADLRLAHASVGFVVAALCVAFVLVWIVTGAGDDVATDFMVATSALTLVMVFVLHHNQRRSISALQVKVDELVRSSPEADDRYVRVQAADDEEILELEREHVEHYEAVRRGRPDG
ncbi:MAG: low affinity iron permease family protein [Acidimicrobiia bacterium]